MDDHGFVYAPVGLAELKNRRIARCNVEFGKMFDLAVEAARGTDMQDLYPSRDAYDRIGARGLAAMQDTGRYADERIMRRLNGAVFWCRVRGQSLTPEEPFRHGIWSFTDLSEDRPVIDMTPREREVAILTARGLSAKEIGQALSLSFRTVEAHRARLLTKFGARNLAELVAKLSGMPI